MDCPPKSGNPRQAIDVGCATAADGFRYRDPVLRRWSRRRERDEDFWREALVCSALAERTTSLIDVCGEPQVVDEIQPILEAIWDGVSRRRRANGPSPLRRIERIAGPDEPDDDQPIYLVYEAMEALHAAALMAFGLRYDLAPMDLGQGIHSALDGVIRFTLDPRPIIVDPRNPPPPGPFEARERAASMRDREAALAMSIEEAARQIRATAQEQRIELRNDVREALRDVRAFDRDW